MKSNVMKSYSFIADAVVKNQVGIRQTEMDGKCTAPVKKEYKTKEDVVDQM